MTRRGLALTALVALAACGGGGGGSSVPTQPAATAPPNAKGTAQITIRVPSSMQTSGSARRPRYVSAATKSLVISANGSVVTVANISPTSPGCTAASGNTPLTCVVNADVSSGTATIGFATFDQPGGLGNKLSTASVNATITAGAVNPLSVTLNGVVARVTIDFNYNNAFGTLVENEPQTVNLLVNAQDASGNTIIGPGVYVDASGNPATIALSKDANSSDLDAFSTSAITAPGTAVTVRYNGRSPLTAIACRRGSVNDPTPSGRGLIIVPGTTRGISATIPNVATGTSQLQIVNISGVFNNRNITVSNSKSNTVTSYFPFFGAGAGALMSIVPDEAPLRVLGGAATGLNVPQGVTYDNNGVMYVSGSSMAAMEGYDPPFTCANGNETPDFATGALVHGFGSVPDPAGNITVACQTCSAVVFDAVDTFAPGAGGALVRQVAGAATLLAQPVGVAYDSAGNLYVANSQNNTVTVYAPNANGNVAPIRTITAGASGLSQPKGLAVDGSDNLYVASFGSNTVLVYASGANGAAVPTRTYTGLNQPYGIAIRHPSSAGQQMPPTTDAYVTNFGNDTISVFDPSASGSTPAFVYQGPDMQLSGPTFITFGD
jgi:hypothetical protein